MARIVRPTTHEDATDETPEVIEPGTPPPEGAPAVATVTGTRPPLTDTELKDMTRVSLQQPPARDINTTPEFDVYAKDGLLSTDPRAKRPGPVSVKLLEQRDGRVTGKARHVDTSPAAKQYRVVADAQMIGPNGMPMLIRAGKVITERTHDLNRLRSHGVKLEEVKEN
jgi:hypothetical protein